MTDSLEEDFFHAATMALQTQSDESFMISGRLNQIAKTLTEVFGKDHPMVESLRLRVHTSLAASVVLEDIHQTVCGIASAHCDMSIEVHRKTLQ